MLADCLGDRVQTRASAPGQNNSFAARRLTHNPQKGRGNSAQREQLIDPHQSRQSSHGKPAAMAGVKDR